MFDPMEWQKNFASLDPLEFQKKLYKEWEKNLEKMLQETMREPVFMQMVSKNLEGAMDFQAMLKKQLAPLLKSFSIPTEESITRLYSSLHDMESKVLDLEEKVTELEKRFGEKGASRVKKEASAAKSCKKSTKK